MHPTRIMIIAALAATAFAAACTRTVVYHEQERGPKPVVVGEEKGNGPPPHAPAHGYRHKHAKDNVTLVYDSKIDVYIVSGMPGCYFSAGQYYRDNGNTWDWSVNIEGPWKQVKSSTDLPSGLRAKGHDHGNKYKEKNEGKGKSK